jgi:hypothetical protein
MRDLFIYLKRGRAPRRGISHRMAFRIVFAAKFLGVKLCGKSGNWQDWGRRSPVEIIGNALSRVTSPDAAKPSVLALDAA